MNKTAIKNFAVWARKKLRTDIQTRAGLIGITEKGILQPLSASTREVQYFDVGSANPVALTGKNIENRRRLVEKLEKDAVSSTYEKAYNGMIEAMASLWFNRLAAIRYMEINDAFADHLRVLSSAEAGRQDPDLVSTPFDSDLEFSDQERDRIIEWKTTNENDRLFRFLLFRRCNQLQEILPGLFEKKDDESELLMRLSFIDKDGLIYHLVNDIPEEDWQDQVQIIGWIYQYYNSELKDETFAKKGKISKEEIPAVTQLFTPDWIVRYMVENSIGRLWIEGHPDESLKKNWKYYLEEAEQEPDVQKHLKEMRKEYATLNPEDLTFIDPCMGSGHILVYAFDVLMQIYESQGYMPRDAVRSILENNLYGLDIDDRAYQLAYFAVLMKAMQYDRRVLTRGIKPHVYAIQDSNDFNRDQLQYLGAGLNELEKNNAINQITGLLDTFTDAKEYGSILTVETCDWDLLCRFAGGYQIDGQMEFGTMGIDKTQENLLQLINIGRVMAQKYYVVTTNPPYFVISNGSISLQKFVKQNYPDTKSDLYAVFIEKCRALLMKNGIQAMITMHGWMFLSNYERLREKLLNENMLNMIHLGARAFDEIGGEVVQTTVFTIRDLQISNYLGRYCRATSALSEAGKESLFWDEDSWYSIKQEQLVIIPNKPWAYWIGNRLIKAFVENESIGNLYRTMAGSSTGDNNRFLKVWFEVSSKKIGFRLDTHYTGFDYKWIPCLKGGSYRKWYGNQNYVIDWENNGEAIKYWVTHNPNDPNTKSWSRRLFNTDMYYHSGITWSKITTGKFSARYMQDGFIMESASCAIMPDKSNEFGMLALLNSSIAQKVIDFLNPTINVQVGDVMSIPVKKEILSSLLIDEMVKKAVDICKKDWDSFETSWEFEIHPIVKKSLSCVHRNADNVAVEECYQAWADDCANRFTDLKANEEELNRIFIEIYSLQGELIPNVEDKDVTVRKADLQRDIKSLISYSVGCMLGRYSLDKEGLAYAGGEWDDGKYATFLPDKDNIIPITDSARFEDDIVERFVEFLKVVFGEGTLEINLQFIADALGIQGESSREVIRKYFLIDYYKDHCNTYSLTGSGKRPIYWLFDSGKQNGFKALVYMHRWNAETITRVRALYLHPVQEKYENEVRALEAMIQGSSNNRQKAVWEKQREKLLKQIAEVKEYDEKIEHLSEEKIDIDLDDGVKRNYEKVQTDRNGKKFRILADIK